MAFTARTWTRTLHLMDLIGIMLLALVIAPAHHVAAAGPDAALAASRVSVAPGVLAAGSGAGTSLAPRYPGAVVRTNAAVALCDFALNVAATPTETAVTVTFDTCAPVSAIVNLFQKEQPPPFGNGQGLDSAPTRRHVLTVTNLAPATAYRYQISDGMGTTIGDGEFVTNTPMVTNLRAQAGTTTVDLSFDTDVPVAPAVIIRGPDGDRGTALDTTQHAYLHQTWLKSGTSYTFTVLVNGLYLTGGTFKTGVPIDGGGSNLNPATN